MRKPTFLSQFKIKYQLLIIYTFLIFLPMSILSYYFISKSQDELLSHYETQLSYKKNSVNTLILDITKNNYDFVNDLYNNRDLFDILESNQDVNTLTNKVLDFKAISDFANNPSVSDIKLYTFNENLDNIGNFKYIDENTLKADWFNKAKNQSSAFYITKKEEIKGSFTNDLTFIQKLPIPNSSNFVVLEIKTSRNFLKSRLKDSYIDNYLSLDNDYFYLDSNIDIDFLSKLSSDTSFSGIKKINNSDVMFSNFNVTPYMSDDTINVVLIDKYGIAQTNYITRNTTLVILLVFIFTLCTIYIFIFKFNKRITILKDEVTHAINGDYLLDEKLDGKDELSDVFNDLQTIFLNVKQAEEEVYNAKLKEQQLINEQQKMEFKMLSSQINPHFLYNTLETIRMNALSSGNREIATSIRLLGKSMRYVLENTIYNTTTLANELDYVKTYIDIQNIRFDNSIEYQLTYNCDIDPSEIQILPLLLQPIIENSILHGFKNTDYSGKIFITITQDTDNLIFVLSDNGPGLDEIKLEQLNIRMISEETLGTSIGLQNINKRLKIYYDSNGLEFKSENSLFSVQFIIPLIREVNFETLNMRR